MSKHPAISVSQLPHPLRLAVARPTLIDDMRAILSPESFREFSDAMANNARHTGDVVSELVRSGRHPLLQHYLRVTGQMPAGTEMGNAFAGLLGLRHAIHPQPFFQLDDDLATLLEHTDIAQDIPMAMLELPFPRFFIEFGRSRTLSLVLPNELTGMHALEGAYVETGHHSELGKGVYVMLTASPLGKSGPLDDATHSLYLSREDPEMTLYEAVRLSFDKANEVARRTELRASPESFVQPSFESLLFLVKALLYLGLPEARRTLHAERTAWMKEHEKLKSPGKRAKALRQASRLADYIRVSAPPASAQAGDAGQASGRRVASHWRRGHYRMQAHGPQRAQRKLIFVRPALVNADQASRAEVASPRYDVS